MNKKYIHTTLILLLFGSISYFFVTNSNKDEQKKTNIKSKDYAKVEKPNESSIKYSWDMLGIKPIENLEGKPYLFTAFDYNTNDDELVIAGNYNKNKLVFIKKSIVSELEITDIPIDILINDNIIYVLCLNKFIVIKNKNIIQDFSHNIKNVMTFNKLLFFENKINLLMSDGSSYIFDNYEIERNNSLVVNKNKEIWIKKTSSKSFEIKSKPNLKKFNKKVKFQDDIGSITFSGLQADDHYITVDILKDTKPITVTRELKSSKDNFSKTIVTLPQRDYSLIKNDIKIKNRIIYIAIITEDYLKIKQIAL
jgi:uncharacterized protein YxeA